MLRIHSERLCFFVRAAVIIALRASPVKRTGTMRPFAAPFGSGGLPTFLRFGFTASKLLCDGRSHGIYG